MPAHAHSNTPHTATETPVAKTEKPKKVKHLTGEDRVDALCAFLQKHGIHVPEEIAAKE